MSAALRWGTSLGCLSTLKRVCRACGWTLRDPLAIGVTVRGNGFTDPCAPSKPFMRGAADRAKRAAKEDGHGKKSRTLNIDARRDRLSRLGAADHDFAHHTLRIILGRVARIRRR